MQEPDADMPLTSGSDFVDMVYPLYERLKIYDPARPPYDQPKNEAADSFTALPDSFINAMIVRHAVYVEEYGVPLENEYDAEDPQCYHWVAYASVPIKDPAPQDGTANIKQRRRSSTGSTKMPIAAIRLIPNPDAPHPNRGPKGEEPYIKLDRLAVLKEFRKQGITRLLLNAVFDFVRELPVAFDVDYPLNMMEIAATRGVDFTFKGRVVVHTPTVVQKMWKKHAFEVDENLGTWKDKDVEHVGMWRRLDVREGRRKHPFLIGKPSDEIGR